MFIGKRRAEADQKKNLEDQRQRVIAFKKFFGSDDGKEVMTDLMNRFYLLNPLPKTTSDIELARAEGNREVVLYLLGRAKTDVATLDKILNGEFT